MSERSLLTPPHGTSSERLPMVWVEVDLENLRHNLRAIRASLAGPDVEVLAIVKADAYGHGMRPVAHVLREEKVRFFGVANIDEALELRKTCPTERILVLGSFHRSQIALYAAKKIIPTVSSLEDADLLERYLPASERNFKIHVKVDTGMGRLGIWHEVAEAFFKSLSRRKKILLEGVYTHFANADHKDKSFTETQITRFNKNLEMVRALGFSPRYVHAANSMGLARFKRSHLNLVRPGIVLYGVTPAGARLIVPLAATLKPLLSLKTRISFLKEMDKDRPLSYGATYKTPRKTRIATLPVGYSHGYRLELSNKGFVSIRGRKCPIVGRVTMDQTLVDVGELKRVRRWDEVTLIGRDGRVEVTALDLARAVDTIPYEIFCSLHSRIPRIYKGI